MTMQNSVKCLTCFLVLLICFLLAIGIGSTNFGLSEIAAIIFHALSGTIPEDLETAYIILIEMRLPRAMIALLCGAALSAAGVLSQGLFRNPLASPSIIGTTAGGSTGAALAFFTGAVSLHWLSLPLAASVGAALSTLLILRIATSRQIYSLQHLLLCGFALNAFLGAITTLIISLSLEDYQKFPAIMHWLLGGLTAKSWTHVLIAIVPISAAIFWAYRVCNKLNVLTLGEDVANTLSINIGKLKKETILVIALLVGTSISIAGAITFVGLIIPHITRMIIGPEHKRLLFISMINGASLVLFADLIARTVRSPLEIQVGVLIAMLGSPFFFWILLTQRKALLQET